MLITPLRCCRFDYFAIAIFAIADAMIFHAYCADIFASFSLFAFAADAATLTPYLLMMPLPLRC